METIESSFRARYPRATHRTDVAIGGVSMGVFGTSPSFAERIETAVPAAVEAPTTIPIDAQELTKGEVAHDIPEI